MKYFSISLMPAGIKIVSGLAVVRALTAAFFLMVIIFSGTRAEASLQRFLGTTLSALRTASLARSAETSRLIPSEAQFLRGFNGTAKERVGEKTFRTKNQQVMAHTISVSD